MKTKLLILLIVMTPALSFALTGVVVQDPGSPPTDDPVIASIDNWIPWIIAGVVLATFYISIQHKTNLKRGH